MAAFSSFLDGLSVDPPASIMTGTLSAGTSLTVSIGASDIEDAMSISRPSSSLDGDLSSGLSPEMMTPSDTQTGGMVYGNSQEVAEYTGGFRTTGNVFRNNRESLFEAEEDPMPYIQKYGQVFRLEANDKHRLEKYMRAGTVEREVLRTALLIKILGEIKVKKEFEAHELAIPANAKLQIEKYILRVLLSPELSQYERPTPHDIVFKITASKRWGLPEDLRKDESGIADMVKKFIEKNITQRKSDIKKEILKSMGSATSASDAEGDAPAEALDILTLTKKLAEMGKLRNLNINVTPQLCARVAFLRTVLKKSNNSSKYWVFVGKHLREVRDKAAGDAKMTTRIFARILEDDRLHYKMPNLDALNAINPSDIQAETDAIVGGTAMENQSFNATTQGDDEEE